MATTAGSAQEVGFRPIEEFEGLFDVWPRGERLTRIRDAAERYRERFKAQGEVLGVRSVDIATAPYITKYAFHGAARSVSPYLSMTNRMVVVQFEDFAGERRTLVWEPTEPEGSAEAPFTPSSSSVRRPTRCSRRSSGSRRRSTRRPRRRCAAPA